MRHEVVAVFGALLAGAWAALLALAEGVLAAEPRLLEAALPPGYAEKPERLRRALSLGRIILLGLTAVALSGAVHWWVGPQLRGAVVALALVLGIALAADLRPLRASRPRCRSSSRRGSSTAPSRGCSAWRRRRGRAPPIPRSATCCSASSPWPTRW